MYFSSFLITYNIIKSRYLRNALSSIGQSDTVRTTQFLYDLLRIVPWEIVFMKFPRRPIGSLRQHRPKLFK